MHLGLLFIKSYLFEQLDSFSFSIRLRGVGFLCAGVPESIVPIVTAEMLG